jgi:hypothetical protein
MSPFGRIRVESLGQAADQGIAMGQMGFFDVASRCAGLDAKADHMELQRPAPEPVPH